MRRVTRLLEYLEKIEKTLVELIFNEKRFELWCKCNRIFRVKLSHYSTKFSEKKITRIWQKIPSVTLL